MADEIVPAAVGGGAAGAPAASVRVVMPVAYRKAVLPYPLRKAVVFYPRTLRVLVW